MAERDLTVIGAGPAGLSAAVAAADHGVTVTVLDLGERPGGQYFRHAAPELGARRAGALHHDWATFTALRDRFQRHVATGRISYRPRHQVWTVDRDDHARFTIRALEGEREARPRTVEAGAVLIATGAHDRHVPFPGWTLPGVMAVGGVQALLKGNLVAPGRRAVVAGTGPFLLSAACGMLDSGIEVAAIIEANRLTGYARDPRGALAGLDKLPELAGYAARLLRARVPFLSGRAVTAAHGEGHVTSVTVSPIDSGWAICDGAARETACDLLAVGYGFTPQLELLVALGCATALGRDGSLIVSVDRAQRTSVAGVSAAGETTGVGGAALAIAEGAIAGLTAAGATMPSPLRARRTRLARFASVLHAAHPVADGWSGWLRDDTLICRCEQVSFARVREATQLGAIDARTLKLLARPGMGRCQGRICGRPVATLAAALAALAHLPIQGADQ
jgi:NADPH-dependent 2,4-dienoyl-CoA reductase/sulfur reductase-like enzyme